MGQFAYAARSVAGTKSGAPSGWPFGWQYPGDADGTAWPTTPISGNNIPGVPNPPGWPIAAQANTVLQITIPATMSIATHTGVVECWLTVGGVEAAASVYSKHLIQVTVTEVSVGTGARLLKKTAGGFGAGYSSAIFFQISNYAGNRWGFTSTLDFDPSGMSITDVFDIHGRLCTAIANPTGDDPWTIVS